MRLVRAVIALSLVACLSACDGDDDAPAETNTTAIPLSTSSWEPGDGALQAGIRGRVKLSADGCVYLTYRAESGWSDVVWPKGYTAEVDASGGLAVRNPSGQVVARGGTHILTGGGWYRADRGGEAIIEGLNLVCSAHGRGDAVAVIHAEVPPLSE